MLPEVTYPEVGVAAESVGSCKGWDAWLDLRPGVRPTLHVKVRCTLPSPGYVVTLQPALPPGFNPRIYDLERVVEPPQGPMPEVPTTMRVHYVEAIDNRYDEISVRSDGVRLPVRKEY
jgi:hypothetical protein